MAETAESVVIAIEAQMGGFSPAVGQGANAFDNSMRTIETSATRMERQVGQSFGLTRAGAQEMQHVVRSAVDQFAAGTPLLQIFVQHLAQLAQAMSSVKSGGGEGAAGAMGELKETAEGASEAMGTVKETAEKVAGALTGETAASERSSTATGANSTASTANTAAKRTQAGSTAASTASVAANTTAVETNVVALEADTAANVELASVQARFAAFLGGPFGIAIIAAIAVIGTLASKHLGAADDAHKHETAEQTLMRALNGEADAVDKVTDALRAMRQESERALQTDTGRIAAQWALARATLQVAINTREALAAQLESARQEAQRAQAAIGSAGAGGVGRGMDIGAAAALNAQNRVADLTSQIEANARKIAEANGVIANTTTQMARQLETAAGRVETQFNIRRDIMEREFQARTRAATTDAERTRIAREQQVAEHNLNVERERQMHIAQRLDEAEVGLRQARERELVRPAVGAVMSQFGADRSGVPLNGRLIPGRRHEGVDIRGALGDPVVAPEGGIARVMNAPGGLGLYIEIRADSGARDLLAHLSAANIRSGERVAAGQLIGLIGNSGNAQRGPTHLHWQRQVNGQWVDPMRSVGSSGAAQEAEQEMRQARELAERRARDEARFQEQLAGLNADILNARRHQVQTEEEAAAADIAAINAQREQRDQRIRDEAAERARRDSAQAVTANIEAGFLLARSQELAAAQASVRLAQRDQRLDEQRLQTSIDELNNQESIESARGALARTVGERRDSELRLLDLQHQEELLQIAKLRLQQGLTDAQRQELDHREAAANTRYGLAQENIRRQNQGPLDAYFSQVPRSAAEMNEALQRVATDGLQQLNSGLAEAATRFLHLGGLAGNVLNTILNDIIQIILRQAELAAFGGSKGGGWSGFLSSIGSLVGLGSGGGGFDYLGAASSISPGAFASGGSIFIGGRGGIDNNMLSINGQPVARVSQGERIDVTPQGKALGSFGGRAASSAPQITVISAPQFDLRGMIGTPQLFREVERVSRAHAAAAATAVGQGVLKAVPARFAQYQTDGL